VPPQRLILFLGVLAAAGGVVVQQVATTPLGAPELLGRAMVLLGLAVAEAEMCLRVERLRMSVARDKRHGSWHSLEAVWSIASILVLPIAHAALLSIVIGAYRAVRVINGHSPLHRVVYTRASIVLGIAAAGSVASATGVSLTGAATLWALLPLVFLVQIVHLVVQSGLVIAAMRVIGRVPLRDTVDLHELGVESVTYSLGALVGILLASPNPWAVVFTMAPIVLLHRSLGVTELERVADLDPTRSLLSSTRWYRVVHRHIARAARRGERLGVLVIRLTEVHDLTRSHGSEVGAAVFDAAGRHLRQHVQAGDVVGRTESPHELAVLLCSADDVATRLEEIAAAATGFSTQVAVRGADTRVRVDALACSIGTALFPDDGISPEELFAAARRALGAPQQEGSDGAPAASNTSSVDVMQMFRTQRLR
jgi:diguanylate cyclase (GGDEF)-like protein